MGKNFFFAGLKVEVLIQLIQFYFTVPICVASEVLFHHNLLTDLQFKDMYSTFALKQDWTHVHKHLCTQEAGGAAMKKRKTTLHCCSFHQIRQELLQIVSYHLSQWVKSSVCVCLQSIFSRNMPSTSSTLLILMKPCHETASLPLISVFRHKNTVPVGLSHTACVILLLPACRFCWYGDPFCGLERGKEDGGGDVCTIMGAGMRK